jgi:hypothetical protein
MVIIFSSHDSEATNSANSFDEFEEMWAKMGDQLEAQSLSKRCVTAIFRVIFL